MEVIYEDGNRGASQIPQVNEVIIMKWVSRKWMSAASHLFPGRTHVSMGVNDAIDLLHKLGQKFSKVSKQA